MTLTDDVKRMIESALESVQITSANPTHTNTVVQINNIELPDLDASISEAFNTDEAIKSNKDLKNTIDDVSAFKEGAVGQIQTMTSQQIGNVVSFARNPFQFMISSVFRKFTKGAGIVALIAIIFEAVKTIVSELFKPGRLLDTRFRQQISQQVLILFERREQQELRQGFKQVITTTIGGLRGNGVIGNIGGNFYNPDRIPVNFVDTRRVSDDNIIAQDTRLKSVFGNKSGRRFGG